MCVKIRSSQCRQTKKYKLIDEESRKIQVCIGACCAVRFFDAQF